MIELILTYKNNDREDNIKSTIQIISCLYCENVEDTIQYDNTTNQALVILNNYSEWNFGTIRNELMRSRDFLINVEENTIETEEEEETLDDVEVIEPTEAQSVYSFTLTSEEGISLNGFYSLIKFDAKVVSAWNNDLSVYYTNFTQEQITKDYYEISNKKFNTIIFYIKNCKNINEAISKFNDFKESLEFIKKSAEKLEKYRAERKAVEILEFCNSQNEELSSVEYSNELIYMENEDDKPLEAENLIEFNALLNAKEKKEDKPDLKPLDYEGDLFNNWSDDYQTAFYYPVYNSIFYNKR